MPDIPMHLQDPDKWLLDGEFSNCIIDISFYMEQLLACINYHEYAAIYYLCLYNNVYLVGETAMSFDLPAGHENRCWFKQLR